MKEYHKIHTVFKRNPDTKYKTLLLTEYSRPEFQYLSSNIWMWTEKVDGTNIRVMFDGEKVTFRGKTDRAQLPARLVGWMEEKFLPQEEKMRAVWSGEVCFYGEGYGAKIQKGGGNYSPDQKFVLFDVKIGEIWLERQSVEEIAESFGIEVVPIIGQGSISEMVYKVSRGFNSQWGDFPAEGIVARPLVELKDRRGGRIITKLKTRDFPIS